MPCPVCRHTAPALYLLIGWISASAGNQGIGNLDVTARYFPLTLPGTAIIVGKQLDPKTGAIRFISQSPRIKTPDDLVKMEAKELDAEYAKHGALKGSMREAFYKLNDSEQVDVSIHLRSPSLPGLDPDTHTLDELKENERQIEAIKPIGSIGSMLARFGGGLKNIRIRDSSAFDCKMTKAQIELLRFDKTIGEINFKAMTPASAYPLSSLTNSAYNPASGIPSAFKGQGVNAATFETGLSNSWYDVRGRYFPFGNIVNCLNLNNAWIDERTIDTVNWVEWRHSHQIFKCLWQTAPFANLFHRNYGLHPFYSDAGNTAFISNNAIQTASMSIADASTYWASYCNYNSFPTITPAENAHAADMVMMDEWAYRYPYPVFCTPAANWGSMYEVNWQCYNALSVGNVRHTNLSHYEIPADVATDVCQGAGACTQTRNPTQLWGGPDLQGPLTVNGVSVYTGSSGDREMPYLVAPGTTPSLTESMFDQSPTCLDGPMWCGTSYSAPIMNGIAACVISADTRFVSHPWKVWAVLLATAENVDGGYWDRWVDGKDGAGVVSGSSAVNFARNHSEPSTYAPAVKDGIASSTFSNATPNGSTAKYNILIPSTFPSGKHLRVVLTWTSDPVRSTTPVSYAYTNWLSDLDLSVQNNSSYSTSFSYNGNVEMVDVMPSQLTAGGTYQATITLWTNRIPGPSTTGTSDLGVGHGILNYALAWTWVKDHAD